MGRRVACARWHAGCGGALLGVVLACRLRLGCGSCQDGAPLARARGSRFAWKCVHGQDTCGKASDCAWVARNRLVSGVCGCLPAHVSRETFVLISHYIATIVSRETLRFQASQSCPTPEPRNPGTPPSALCARSEGGCFPRPSPSPSFYASRRPRRLLPLCLLTLAHASLRPVPAARLHDSSPHPVVRLRDSSSLRTSRPLVLSASPAPPHRPPAPPHALRPRTPAPPFASPTPRTPAARSALRVRTSARGNSTQNGYAQVGGFRLVSMSSVSPIGEVCSKRAGRFS